MPGPLERQSLAAADHLIEGWYPSQRVRWTLDALVLLVDGGDLAVDRDQVRAAVVAADLVGRRRGWLDADEVEIGDLTRLLTPEVHGLVVRLVEDDGGPVSTEVALVDLAEGLVEAVEAGPEVSEHQAAEVLRAAMAVPPFRGRAVAAAGWPAPANRAVA